LAAPTSFLHLTDIQTTSRAAKMPPRCMAAVKEKVVRDPASLTEPRSAFIPPEFRDIVDVAECALDEQLEVLQRRYAAASRAASRARFELELLEQRDDINPNVLVQARRQRVAADSRSQQLLRAIDALEDRLDNE
jgi:hypothetical protein